MLEALKNYINLAVFKLKTPFVSLRSPISILRQSRHRNRFHLLGLISFTISLVLIPSMAANFTMSHTLPTYIFNFLIKFIANPLTVNMIISGLFTFVLPTAIILGTIGYLYFKLIPDLKAKLKESQENTKKFYILSRKLAKLKCYKINNDGSINNIERILLKNNNDKSVDLSTITRIITFITSYRLFEGILMIVIPIFVTFGLFTSMSLGAITPFIIPVGIIIGAVLLGLSIANVYLEKEIKQNNKTTDSMNRQLEAHLAGIYNLAGNQSQLEKESDPSIIDQKLCRLYSIRAEKLADVKTGIKDSQKYHRRRG